MNTVASCVFVLFESVDKVDCPQLASHFLVTFCLKLPDSPVCVCVCVCVRCSKKSKAKNILYARQVVKCWQCQCIAIVPCIVCSCDTAAVTNLNAQGTHKVTFKCLCHPLVKLWHQIGQLLLGPSLYSISVRIQPFMSTISFLAHL